MADPATETTDPGNGGQEQQSMKEILATLARTSEGGDQLPSYEDVTAESGANNDGSSSNDRPNLKFNPEFNPNALVGKATCIQLKPAGVTTEVDVLGEPCEEERITWDNNLDFLLSIIGFAVDLANVWRFPYLCYKNGGGAFLIPYALMLVLGAMPLMYMEVILGQFNRQGPISLWKICPLFKGVGYCAVFIAYYVSFYYNVIIGWSIYYFANSLYSSGSDGGVPWSTCNNTWNTDQCAKTCDNFYGNYSCNQTRSPAKEYFNFQVLQVDKSSGIDDIGAPIWKLAACVLVVYCLLYLSLFKGVKSSGKVVWVTALAPYFLLSILLVRGLMLPGASEGISYYLIPDWNSLKKSEVWTDAAVQIFYSCGAGFGVHLAYASYNKFDNNCYRDCLVTSCVNCFTSFFSGFVIFTYLGYMSHYQGKDIQEVAEQGPGLVFEVYPEAIATLPGSQVWSCLFFVTMIMLGMDSAMGGLECVITGLMDEFKDFFKRWHINREIFTGMIVSVSFVVALCCVTPGGFYVFTLLETYVAGVSLLFTVFVEAVAVSWLYGMDNFKADINKMLGHVPNLYWRICWKFLSPAFLFVVIIMAMSDTGPLTITLYNGTIYTYPNFAKVVGWTLALSSVLMVPIVAIKMIMSYKGTFSQRFLLSITPEKEQQDIIDGKPGKRANLNHWISL